MGGADGYKGTYEARYERWITAFRYGWKGVSVLLDLEKTGYGIPDIYYGIGSYTYWRSALIKQLWWMPGIEDKRTIGIDQLYKVRKDGVYSKTWASIALIDILINEKRFEEALKISDEELKQYPECLIFLWGRARALAGLERNDQAVALCRQLILKTEHDEPDNHYNTTLYHLCCARILLKEKKHVQAISECNIINNITLDPMIKKRLEVQLNEARSIAKQAMHEMGSDR
jgi:tetratricopeptide (TPR) repeat protein